MRILRCAIFLLMVMNAAVFLAGCSLPNAEEVISASPKSKSIETSAESSRMQVDPTVSQAVSSEDPSCDASISPTPSLSTSSSTSSSTSLSTPVSVPAMTPAPASASSAESAQSGGIDWYNGFADPRTIHAEVAANPEDITVLINKYYSLPEDYSPPLVLAESSKNQLIRTEAQLPWDLMRSACQADTGYILYLCSGYRTFEDQAALFSKSIRDKGIAHACSRNAIEGRSEHNLGLALDISTTEVGQISSGFADTPAGSWVVEHCHEYGFILRYPQNKSEITGYVYEPWHYRYVGVELAAELYLSGLTLEEYYGKVPVAF